MAVYTTFPHDHPTQQIKCIICYESVPLYDATAGSLRADGSQAFACNHHLQDRHAWITAWALFDIEQEQLRQDSKDSESST